LQFHAYFHGRSTAGAQAALVAMGKRADQAEKPKIMASKIVTRVDAQHAFLMTAQTARWCCASTRVTILDAMIFGFSAWSARLPMATKAAALRLYFGVKG